MCCTEIINVFKLNLSPLLRVKYVVVSYSKLIPKGLGFLHFWSKSLDLTEQKKKYSAQKNNAKYRGIEFKLTFDEWWDLWQPFYARRGTKVDSLMMCRTLDSGAYEVGNVTIGTGRDNARTRRIVNNIAKVKEMQKEYEGFSLIEREDDDDGWIPRELKNPYRSSADF
jgi:hypothetical protein